MNYLKINRLILITTLCTSLLLSIGYAYTLIKKSDNKTLSESKQITITVSAAASLKDAMEEIKKIYQLEQSQVTIIYNYGSSGSLQQQIEQGAPVDVFISAAKKQMEALAEKNLIDNASRRVLLKNKVVLVVPNNTKKIAQFADLTKKEITRVALGEPASVPAGKYGKEVLTSLDLWKMTEPKAIYGKDVRQVLNWVETGNVDAGIIYYTDALNSKKAKIIATASKSTHSPVSYPIALIKDSKSPADANAFVHFLLSQKSQVVFEKYGFTFVGK